jgi:UDP-2,3-diacylglucosamine hydrolase
VNARGAADESLPEIELEPGALVIADLHLDAAEPSSCRRFVEWMRRLEGVPTLAILGDLFDVWVGPAQARMSGASIVLDALAELAGKGTRVVVVPGNRDFLLDASFESRTSAIIAREGFVGRILSRGELQRALFVHGDTLCTLDTNYQRLRRTLRSRPVQWLGPRLPLWAGTAIARRLRRASVKAIAEKLPEEKSVQASAVRDVARVHRASLVVCGHAHAFREERLDGGPRWIVLDAFGGSLDVVHVDASGQLHVESSGSARVL